MTKLIEYQKRWQKKNYKSTATTEKLRDRALKAWNTRRKRGDEDE